MAKERQPEAPKETMALTQCEANLIRYIRGFAYGHLTIDIQGAQPVRIERGVESVKLA